jgi:UDP-3-O-[3-hydroxymyristoyl] glucosamine N-acyltransferase
LKLRDIADRLQCRLEGDGDVDIVRVAAIHKAEPGDLTFVANRRYLPQLATTRASAVILGPEKGAAPHHSCAVLRADDPYSAFARAVSLFVPATRPPAGVDALSAVAADAAIGADVSIGPFVTVGAGASVGARTIIHPNVVIGAGARIGDDCVIYSQASIRERVVIGHRVTLHNGVVLGSDGYGFARQKDGTHLKIPQHGDVVIEDDVEIGANTTIDRPAVGETRIAAGTKIDNLVQIAHGVTVGRRVLFAAQVGIAGSTTIEDAVTLAGQVGVSGHITIGKGTIATAQTGIPNSVAPGSFISGYPAISNRDWLKSSAVFRRLPELRKTVNALDARLAEIEAHLRAPDA